MPARIVVFGATGFTGRLTAQALVARDVRPVLAARSAQRLEAVASELGGLETAVADVSRPQTVRALLERGDVMVATVGPFTQWGEAAVQAAVATGANYLDSTGETPFIRKVFERYGGGAESAGCGLVTAFGYDWVPGNLAGALALREGGDAAVRVDIGYFLSGSAGMSGGTRASVAQAFLEPSFGWRDGRLVTERAGRKTESFDIRRKSRPAISVGTSEHFALPRLAPQLREVNVYLGWFGPATRPMQVGSLATSLLTTIPGIRGVVQSAAGRLVKGSSGGPSTAERAKGSSHFQAIAYDAAGHEVASVTLAGPNEYDLTAGLLAWAATRTAEHGMNGAGALGPVEAFGLDELQAGCAAAGLMRT